MRALLPAWVRHACMHSGVLTYVDTRVAGATTWHALVHRHGSRASTVFIRDLLQTLEACNQNYLTNAWPIASAQVQAIAALMATNRVSTVCTAGG